MPIMFKKIATALVISFTAVTGAFAQTCVPVPPQKVLEVSPDGSSGYVVLTIRRAAVPSLEGRNGWVGVQVFGLNDDQARKFAGATTIEKVEYCAQQALSYKVKAMPPDVNDKDPDFRKWHEVDIPVPSTLKNTKIRWCWNKDCVSSTYDGDASKTLVLDKPETAATDVRPKRS